MDRDEFRALLTPFVLAMRGDFDYPTWTGYFRVLGNVPARILEATLAVLGAQERRFMPTASEMLAAAERVRVGLLAAHPYRPGACCNFTGWAERSIEGVKRAERCACYGVHLRQLSDLGVGPALLLPGGDAEQVEFDARMAQTGER